MVTLKDSMDYVWMFLIAGGLGALGGVTYELLQARRGDTAGFLRVPRLRESNHFVDLGFISSLILGAVAAIAISYFFTPEVQVVEDNAAVTKWEIVRLVPLSLIVGSAGGAFLGAMQARLLAQANEVKLESQKNVAMSQIEIMGEGAKAQVSSTASVDPSSTNRDTLEQAAVQSIDGMVKTAKAAVDAV
jgi:hypothetical protein